MLVNYNKCAIIIEVVNNKGCAIHGNFYTILTIFFINLKLP